MIRLSLPRVCSWFAVFSFGCGTEYAQTAATPDVSLAGDASDVTASCGSTLAKRITITTVPLDDDVRYRREGYNYFPTDARVAFGVAPSGNSYVAWSNDALTTIHVTPLTALQTRLGSDARIAGREVGGLVAQNDGFTLLYQGEDPGTPLENPNQRYAPGLAAMVARYRQGIGAVFNSPLTGTASIVNQAEPLHDCSSEHLEARLAFNGEKYGAYFTVHGCTGDAHASYYADKMAYFDDEGQPREGGWNWGCQINQGLRLVPEANAFTSLCLMDNALGRGGLNLIQEGNPDITTLFSEFAVANAVTAQLGSILKLADGSYVVLWLSRNGSNADHSLPSKTAHDIALMHLSADYEPSAVTWITNTPTVHEVNLHAAPYGPSRLLIAWDSIEDFTCSSDYNMTCLGQYTGTHFLLTDTQGNPIGVDETIEAPPNERDDMAIFPNGDVGWAFVPDPKRQYSTRLFPPMGAIAELPAIRQISVARMLYCP